MKRKMLSKKPKESIIANIEGYEVETTESYQSALNCNLFTYHQKSYKWM